MADNQQVGVVALFPHSPLPWALPIRVEEDPESGTAQLCDAQGDVIADGLDVDTAESAAAALNAYEEILAHAVLLAEWADTRDPGAPTGALKSLVEASCFSRTKRWTSRAQTNDIVRLEEREWLVRRAWLDTEESWLVQMSPLVESAPDLSETRTVTQSGADRQPLLVVGRMKTLYVRTA